MRLDDRAARLSLALPATLATRAASLVRVERRLANPTALIAARRNQADIAGVRLLAALRAGVQGRRTAATRILPRLTPATIEARLRSQRARLDVLAAQLEGASYERVLARGFALVRDAKGQPVTSAAAIKPASRLRLRFGDGDVGVVTEGRQGSLAL
jgi:exodeoxyribonuclease VII large subunit